MATSSFAAAMSLVGLLVPYVLAIFAFLVLLEQLSYLRKKCLLPGMVLILPFLGNALSLVSNTSRFWSIQSRLASSTPLSLSVNYLVGHFVLYIRDNHLSWLVLSNVRPDAFHFVGYPFGKKLFGDHDLIYLMDHDHKELRRGIVPNFTPSALSVYNSLHQIIIVDHLRSWLARSSSGPIALRFPARDLNLETPQTVFVGPYLNQDTRRRFTAYYDLFNVGLMNLPFDLPGFAFRKARLAIRRIVDTLSVCVAESKARMEKGEEPRCLINFWMQETVKEVAAVKEAGEGTPPHSEDREIGKHLFDFLQASQDVSTSLLLWAVSLLNQHHDVLAKVARVWLLESDTLITGEQLGGMRYTEAVAQEVIRFRPHQCMGQRFALNHLMLFIAMFSMPIDFRRVHSEGRDDIVYVPTIVPQDGCVVELAMRHGQFPNLRMG